MQPGDLPLSTVVDPTTRLGMFAGRLSAEEMHQVGEGLRAVLALD